MLVFEPIRTAGTTLRRVLGACVLVGSLGGSALAQTPLVLAAPDDDPARDERLSHLLPQEVRVVLDPAGATGPGMDALSSARAAIARAAQAGWDIIALDEALEIAVCGAGVLKKASKGRNVASAISGMFALRPGRGPGKSACALTHDAHFETLAYRLDAFPLAPPETGLAVFDTEAFPGRRAVVWPPRALLEWAILAHGVPDLQVYDILSSQRGIQLARNAILGIAPHVVWVESDTEAAQLLAAGEVAMAVGSAERLTSATGAGVVVLKAGQIGHRRSWVEVSEGPAISNMQRPASTLVAVLENDGDAIVPLLWRDAYWYARAGAHVGTGLAGLGPSKPTKRDDTRSAAPPVIQRATR